MSMSGYGVQGQSPPVDYCVPLHVDCSVEYELPDCAKPPQGVKIEPLLMIHPCHFRNLERQRRRPFENNLPARRRARAGAGAPYAAAWQTCEPHRAPPSAPAWQWRGPPLVQPPVRREVA